MHRPSFRGLVIALGCVIALAACGPQRSGAAEPAPVIPAAARGSVGAERTGTLDRGDIRTSYTNFGMIGDYPTDPLHVDLTRFHSLEAPIGSGMNYSDGITPFLLARIVPAPGDTAYVMETGYRERQAFDAYGHVMRLEPRPGYFQDDPALNPALAPAVSTDPRTWPAVWPDKLDDAADPGWAGHWNGYAGKWPIATQETYSVMDDQAYSAWPSFVPDARDPSRRGLALRYGVRTLQWSRPGMSDIVFVHYDITNEGTTRYDGLVFGMYSDAGVGGTTLSCDGVYESDDDAATWERNPARNMAYMWDRYGHGVDLAGTCSPTGYMALSFLQTPANASDGIDNDLDGLTDERQDSGPGSLVIGQAAIRAWFVAHADTARFRACYGSLESRPAYQSGWWWTGDEDMDWNVASDDVGADGVAGTHDRGEGDRIPTDGEPNFDRTDPHEADQIGLTGYRLNRISSPIFLGLGDQLAFANLDGIDWPSLLYRSFTSPDSATRFDGRSSLYWNIAYLMASGPFPLEVAQTVRFSLAIAYAPDLAGLRQNVSTARSVHDAGYLPVTAGVAANPAADRSRDALLGNSPNPFRHETLIRFVLPEPGRVRLRIFDLQGRAVATREAGLLSPGENRAAFDGSALSPGLYLYRLEVRDPSGGAARSSLGGKLVVTR